MGSTRHWKYDDLTAGIDLSYIKESSTNSKADRSQFLLCLTHKAVMTSFNDCWAFGCRWKSAHKYGLQVMYVYTVSLCLQGGDRFYGSGWGKGRDGAHGGSVWGAILGGRGPAGNWVLTELLPHGPTPTDHVLHHHGVAATIAALPLSPLPLWIDHRTDCEVS